MNTNNHKSINHKTMNAFLKQLKHDIDVAKVGFIVSLKYSSQEAQALNDLKIAQEKLKQLRECKLFDSHSVVLGE